MPHDDEMRVTFDRQISATPYDGSGKLHLPTWGYPPPPDCPPYYLPFKGVVLELKFDERAPPGCTTWSASSTWSGCQCAKYCACVEGLGLAYGKRPQPENQWPLMLYGFD